MKQSKRLPKGYTWLEGRRAYRYKFTHDGESKYVYGKTIAECEEKAEALKEYLKDHMDIENRKITLGNYCNQIWLEEMRRTVKQSTMYSYSKSLHYLLGYFGNKKIRDIQKTHIIAFQNSMEKEEGQRIRSTAA